MDYFIVVIFIVVLFAIFICFESSGYFNRTNKPNIIEGLTGAEISELQRTRDISGVGLCKVGSGSCPTGTTAVNDLCPGVWDESSCTGSTGYTLEWVSVSEKEAKLNELRITDPDIIESELTVETGDVVNTGDNTDVKVFVNRDTSLNIKENPTTRMALQPYTYENETEYCLNESGDHDPLITTKETCEQAGSKWNTPLEWTEQPESWGSNSCGIPLSDGGAGDGNEGPNERDCFEGDVIKLPHCVNSDGQLKPKAFWKATYTPGKSIKELCEGESTGREWQLTAIANTLYNSQQLAELAASTTNAVVTDNLAALAEYGQRTEGRVLSETANAFLETQSQRAEQALDDGCTFENVDNPYHGNVSKGTIKGYEGCDQSSLDPAEVTSVRSSCSSLVCTENFKRSPLNLNIRCQDGLFDYQGCVPNQCTIPSNFNEKYQFKAGETSKEVGSLITINDVKNMLTEDFKIECKDGYNGTPTNLQCIDGGDLVISGCDLNICSATCGDGYEFKNCPVENITKETFYGNMNMNNPWAPCDTQFNNTDGKGGGGACFRCEGPNNFHILNDETYNLFNTAKIDDTPLKDIQNYPSVDCTSNNGTFSFSGCQENECFNPSVGTNNFVYDEERRDENGDLLKPQHIDDAEKITPQTGDIYSKYLYKNGISSTASRINKGVLDTNIMCGRSYTYKNDPNSRDGEHKTVSNDNIKCFNYYDYQNKDKSDTAIPQYPTPAVPEEGQDVTTLADESGLSDYLSTNPGLERTHYFSVGGCEENYCQWPTYDHAIPDSYKNPRDRTISDDNIIQRNGSRLLLGYKNGNDLNNDRQTARTFAGYNNNEASITCDVGVDGEDGLQCTPEPKYTNDEITAKISEVMAVNTDIINEGQGPTSNLESSDDFQKVARGGPFTISRCWHEEGSGPSVICNEGTNCNDSESSSCVANVTGCVQNQCKLNPVDAANGTRILIQDSVDSSGNPTFKSIGGSDNPLNMNEAFNVDQIVHISCDYNHSKENVDGIIDDIEIQCEENYQNGGDEKYFTIKNKCSPTECEQNINNAKVTGLINLSNNNGDVNTICPNKTWEDTYIENYGAEIDIDSLPVITFSEFSTSQETIRENTCNDGTINEENILKNKEGRYEQSGSDFVCSGSDGLTSIGTPLSSCNYIPNQTPSAPFEPPMLELSGCQPKLCKIPVLPDEYESEGDLTIGQVLSSDILFGDYYSRVKPSFIDDYDGHINKTIKCKNGYNGDVSLSCNHTDYSSTTYNDFTLSGCVENECVLPNNEAPGASPGKVAYDSLSADEKLKWDNISNNYDLSSITKYNTGEYIRTSDLMDGISCGGNSERNAVQVECLSTSDGTGQIEPRIFKNIIDGDQLCTENECTIPETLYDENDNTVNTRRRIVRTEAADGLTAVLDEVGIVVDDPGIRGYLQDTLSQDSHFKAYELANGDNLDAVRTTDLSINDLQGISCSDGFIGEAQVSCTSQGGDFDLTGCTEKFCSLPSIQDSLLYRQDEYEKLDLLSSIQDNTITKRQFDKTYETNTGSFICAPYAQNVEPGEGPVAICNTGGGEFIYEGCEQLVRPSENSETGHIIYEYYPGSCIGRKTNAFIFISGSEIYNNEDVNGSSMTHNLDRSGLDTSGDTYYYNTETKQAQFNNPNPDGDLPENWIEATTKLKWDFKGETMVNQLMHGFMNTTKEMCDKIDSCGGFTIRQIDKLTCEIYNIQQAQVGGEPHTIDDATLLTYIQDTENHILEYGTMISEQKSSNGCPDPADCPHNGDACTIEILEGDNWYENWGATTGVGGNSYIYNTHEGSDVLNHQRVPMNTSIYFQKKKSDTPVENSSRGYTNIDSP